MCAFPHRPTPSTSRAQRRRTNTLPNTVALPGTDTGDCIGMFGDIIGTVSKCQVRLIVEV